MPVIKIVLLRSLTSVSLQLNLFEILSSHIVTIRHSLLTLPFRRIWDSPVTLFYMTRAQMPVLNSTEIPSFNYQHHLSSHFPSSQNSSFHGTRKISKSISVVFYSTLSNSISPQCCCYCYKSKKILNRKTDKNKKSSAQKKNPFKCSKMLRLIHWVSPAGNYMLKVNNRNTTGVVLVSL